MVALTLRGTFLKLKFADMVRLLSLSYSGGNGFMVSEARLRGVLWECVWKAETGDSGGRGACVEAFFSFQALE